MNGHPSASAAFLCIIRANTPSFYDNRLITIPNSLQRLIAYRCTSILNSLFPATTIATAMNLTLFIPDLFWSDPSIPEIYHDLSLPSVERLLAKSTTVSMEPEDREIWLCKQFNVTQQQNDWPIASIMLHRDAPSIAKNNKEFWMRADPVHLRIEQNHLMLADNQVFDISQQEAARLVQDINHSLGNNNHYTLFSLRPDRWYVRIAQAPDIQTYTLGQVTCKNINQYLPTGNDSIAWRKILNEIQMLLHEHPVNQARESRGELSINSIWLWGGGYFPDSLKSSYTQIWGDHDFVHALASACGVTASNLPQDVNDWLQSQTSGNHLVVLDWLYAKAKYNDAYRWRETLGAIEMKWFLPLYKALKGGRINKLQIITSNNNSLQNFTLTRADLWKFWLATKPLHSYNKRN